MSNPTPTIVFQVNLPIAQEEVFGPMENSSVIAMLNPYRFSSDQTAAVASIAQLATLRSTWLPDMFNNNKSLKHGDQFTLQGNDALYMRNLYGIGYSSPESAFLTIISQTN